MICSLSPPDRYHLRTETSFIVRGRIREMVKVREEASADGKTHLRIEGLVSVCPFSKEKEKDRIDLELTYTPGRSYDESPVRIEAYELERNLAYYEDEAAKQGIPTEAIPIEVLKRFIELCIDQRLGRNAGPEEVEIKSASASLEPHEDKDWGIATIITYKKTVSRVVRRT